LVLDPSRNDPSRNDPSRNDPSRNDAAIGKERKISAEGASPSVWVIPTDEELVIARDTTKALSR
jgi:acetate kinase